jgi:hypothetical protein
LLDGTVVFPNGFSCTGTSTTTFGDNSVSIGSGGELTAYCDSFFNGDVTCTAASNVALSAGAGVFTCGKTASFGSTVAISGAVTCGSTLAVAGVATFAAKPVFSDGLTVGAGTHTVDFNNSTTNIGGTLNLSAIVRLISSARIQYRYVAGVNANHTYTIADCDMIVVPPSGSTTTRIYTISNTGCSGGEVIEIFNGNFPTQRFSIVQHDGGTAIADLDGTLDFIGVKIVNDGSGNATSAWKVVSATSAP